MLCVDEKSQVQALHLSRPLFPVRTGEVGRRTHDCMCHGTTTLFAALDIATGKVIGQCFPRHRSREFLKFLRTLDTAERQTTSPELQNPYTRLAH